jgi:DNA-binding CsgD family transcriptional regulator
MLSGPYIVSNWVRDEHFYGRDELCQALIDSPERCIYLAGTRRIGKTSLLMRLARRLAPAAIYCDLMQAAGAEQLDEARLVYLLRRQLGLQARASAALEESRPDWDRQSASLGEWLEQAGWRWEEQGLTITLLWDEAELLRRLPPASLMRLRAILQHSQSLRLIICASKGLVSINDQWRDEQVSPFLFGFSTAYLAGLSDAEADHLITQRGWVECAAADLARLRDWTGNHPFLLQSLCTRLFAGGRLRPPASADLVVDAMLADLFRIDVGYLSPSEQRILRALAGEPLDAAQLELRTGLAGEAIASFAEGMAQLGLVRAGDDGGWRIGNAYLGRWLQTADQPIASAVSDQASLEVVAPERARPPAAGAPPALSRREQAVLRLVAAGMSNPEIARELTIAIDTVKAHLKHIAVKLEAASRAHAVARAKELGLL